MFECPVSEKKKKVYIDFLRLFPCYWQFKWGRWLVFLLWLSELWLLLLMLLLLIIIKCWMLSFIVCFIFLIFYILYKKKAFILCLVVDSKPWGFYQPFIVPVYAFSVVFAFFTKGKNNSTVKISLLDIDWDVYSAHAFASLMYTNWLISNQKQSSTLYTWSAFVSQSVCAGAFWIYCCG